MASLQSKLWKIFLRPIYTQKANASAELNIRISRLIEAPLPPGFVYRKNLVKVDSVNGRNMFTVTPELPRNDRLIFYLHGGAYIVGITRPHWRFINKLVTRTGTPLVLIDYPVAPEYPFPDAFDTAMAAYRSVLSEVPASRIIFMGDSAGGGLALALAQRLKEEEAHLQPGCIVLLSPWLDVTMSNPAIEMFKDKDPLLSKKALITAGKLYADGADRKNYMISPVYGDLNGLAPVHLFVGTHDLLVADARKLKDLADRLNASLHYYEYDKMFHAWMFFPLPEARSVLNRLDDILSSEF